MTAPLVVFGIEVPATEHRTLSAFATDADGRAIVGFTGKGELFERLAELDAATPEKSSDGIILDLECAGCEDDENAPHSCPVGDVTR